LESADDAVFEVFAVVGMLARGNGSWLRPGNKASNGKLTGEAIKFSCWRRGQN